MVSVPFGSSLADGNYRSGIVFAAPLNGVVGARDLSVGGLSPSISSGVGPGPAVDGIGFRIPGSGTVNYGTSLLLNGATSATIALEATVTAIGSEQSPFGKWDGEFLVSIDTSGGIVLAFKSNVSAYAVWSGTAAAVKANTPAKIVVVWTGNTAAFVYVNGKKYTFSSSPGACASVGGTGTPPILIGSQNGGGAQLTGSVRNVVVWKNRALTEAEAFALSQDISVVFQGPPRRRMDLIRSAYVAPAGGGTFQNLVGRPFSLAGVHGLAGD